MLDRAPSQRSSRHSHPRYVGSALANLQKLARAVLDAVIVDFALDAVAVSHQSLVTISRTGTSRKNSYIVSIPPRRPCPRATRRRAPPAFTRK
jgi:hypothetical protein